MPYPSRRLAPSLDSAGPATSSRTSLFDNKDDFIERVAPIGMAAIYFGSFSFAPQDAALSRQALYKLSFAYRNFLQPGGLKIAVLRQTALLSGQLTGPALSLLAELLARQIEGIAEVDNDMEMPEIGELEAACEKGHLLFATDQTLHSGLKLSVEEGRVALDGKVSSPAQKSWADSLVAAVAADHLSRLNVPPIPAPAETSRPPDVDDESLEALILFRLRLTRETEHLPIRVKANRGVVQMQGKVRTEALRQRVENLTRSTIGLRELRSSLTIVP